MVRDEAQSLGLAQITDHLPVERLTARLHGFHEIICRELFPHKIVSTKKRYLYRLLSIRQTRRECLQGLGEDDESFASLQATKKNQVPARERPGLRRKRQFKKIWNDATVCRQRPAVRLRPVEHVLD